MMKCGKTERERKRYKKKQIVRFSLNKHDYACKVQCDNIHT